MKICAFEVRGDERADFLNIQQELGVELALYSESLTMANVHLTNGYAGVTTLGHSHVDAALAKALWENGVKALSTRTIGTDHYDLAACWEAGLRVCNAGYGPESVADHTIMFLLLLLRNYKPALWRGQVNDFSLPGLIGRNVRSMTVGVIGTGRIGLMVMKQLSGFGCKMLCFDPYRNPEAEKLGTYVSLDEIWANCDVITLHAPLTPENRHMINRQTIAKMKKGVVLINCARGGLMDIDAVVEGIEMEQIGRLGLDVIEGEEGIFHENRRLDILKNRTMAYLRQFPNVVMTQHMAFYTQEAVASMVHDGVVGVYELCEKGQTRNEVKVAP